MAQPPALLRPQGTRILRDSGDAREIPVAQVTAEFFRLIGLQPSIGRAFTREEDQPGHDIVALLSNNFWHREFAASPGVLGQTISLNDRQVTVRSEEHTSELQ